MIVCIAEKPSVAKDIARIIGATTARDGYMEGNGYQVTWTFGHLCELKEPDDYTPMWKHWSLAALPMIPQRFGIKLINDEGIKKQFATIEKLMQAADSIINCGDAGQEGELIQRWVMQKAQAKCPVKRLWISSMTDEAIKQGFQELKDQGEYQSLYLAVLATIYRDTQFTATSGKFTSKEEGEKAFSTIAGKPFTVTDVSKKKGNEAPPHLYDLTSLQVDCNKKFAYSADITLKLIQSLYEKKYTTYPRVDTQFLTDDIYPKCPQILNGVSQAKIMSQQKYLPLIQQLATISKKLPKSKKVFDNSKVTDHHAIIPTGVPPTGLTDMEANVYDLIAKRFISVFYPDCKFSTTTVLGEVINEDGPKPEKIEFKVSGKEILEPGWRVVYAKDVKNADDDDASDNANGNADSGNGAKKEVVEERTLPSFTKGESGDHQPTLTEKWTTPPKYYTEATLLRAMETAGKFVEDEELRAALKENGIGRPSSRAGIIETLFKRHYIRRQRKNLMATPTGIELIDTIHEELLKSCELTGIWEKKLRDIEHKTYDPADFINGLKEQINKIVIEVLSDNSNRRVTIMTEEDLKKKPAAKKPAARKTPAKKADKAAAKNTDSLNAPAQPTPATDPMVGKPCPLCGKGVIIKGKTAYGCSNWKSGCQYRQPFSQML